MRPLIALSCLALVSSVSLTCGKHATGAEKASELGKASYYGARFAGRPTASGETFDPAKLTGAHRSLAFGTIVRVTDIETNKHVLVRINDRGPFVKGRIIDVSEAAAETLDMVERGVIEVRVEVIKRPE